MSEESYQSIESADSTDLHPPTGDQPKIGPRLNRTVLTAMLLGAGVVPIIVIFWVYQVFPPVGESELKAAVEKVDYPPDEYFEVPLRERDMDLPEPALIVKNQDSVPWTNINVTVNKRFDFFTKEGVEIPPGGEVKFYLHRFILRTGGVFNPLHAPVDRVRVFARLPSGKRATYTKVYGQPAPKLNLVQLAFILVGAWGPIFLVAAYFGFRRSRAARFGASSSSNELK